MYASVSAGSLMIAAAFAVVTASADGDADADFAFAAAAACENLRQSRPWRIDDLRRLEK